MEYIKDAVEKARKERDEKAATGAQTEQVSGGANPAEVSEAHGEPRSEHAQSRVEQLDPTILMENRVVAAFDNDERAEPYRQLRTQVLTKFRQNNWKTLAVTSAHSGAGKTLTAVNLAITIAKERNQTVLLVDMDFKGPNVLDMLGLSTDKGLLDYLAGEAELSEILVNPGLERLTLLPSTPVAGTTSEWLSSPRMKAVLEDIVNRYSDRLVIFDLPPLLRDDDALVFTPYTDAALLVVESEVSTPEDMERCVQLLEGSNILGTVFNKAS